MSSGAPPDCGACKLFFFERSGAIARPREIGEEVTPETCRACEFIRVEPGTFEWSENSQRIFHRWKLWRIFGEPKPDGPREIVAFTMLGELEAELARRTWRNRT